MTELSEFIGSEQTSLRRTLFVHTLWNSDFLFSFSPKESCSVLLEIVDPMSFPLPEPLINCCNSMYIEDPHAYCDSQPMLRPVTFSLIGTCCFYTCQGA